LEEADIAGAEIAGGVEGFFICFGVVVVAFEDDGAFEEELAFLSNVDIFAVVIDDSAGCQYLI